MSSIFSSQFGGASSIFHLYKKYVGTFKGGETEVLLSSLDLSKAKLIGDLIDSDGPSNYLENLRGSSTNLNKMEIFVRNRQLDYADKVHLNRVLHTKLEKIDNDSKAFNYMIDNSDKPVLFRYSDGVRIYGIQIGSDYYFATE